MLSAGGTWLEHQAYLQMYFVPTSITQFILSCISYSLLYRGIYIKDKTLIYLQIHIYHIFQYICLSVKQNTNLRRAGSGYLQSKRKIPIIISSSRPDNDVFVSKIYRVLYSTYIINSYN